METQADSPWPGAILLIVILASLSFPNFRLFAEYYLNSKKTHYTTRMCLLLLTIGQQTDRERNAIIDPLLPLPYENGFKGVI